MALTDAASKADLKGKITAKSLAAGTPVLDDDQLDVICEALAEWLNNQLTTQMVITVAGTVTTGVGAGGAVTGTGAVT